MACCFRVISLLLLLSCCTLADPLEDAARILARKIASRLAPTETIQIRERNLSSASIADIARARQIIERTLRKPARPVTSLPVVLTLSENAREFVLVAEMTKSEDKIVEIATFVRTHDSNPRPAPVLERRLLFVHERQILDIKASDGQMLVLDPTELASYSLENGTWKKSKSQPVPALPRDPRGRLILEGSNLTVHLPGKMCSGTFTTDIVLDCTQPAAMFPLNGLQVQWTESRNTMQSGTLPEAYSAASINGAFLTAKQDSRIHHYSPVQKQLATWDDWGSDFVTMESCPGRILATSAKAQESIQLFEIRNEKPVAAGASLDFNGPIVAFWPLPSGAVAIVKNTDTPTYAAYQIQLDCGR